MEMNLKACKTILNGIGTPKERKGEEKRERDAKFSWSCLSSPTMQIYLWWCNYTSKTLAIMPMWQVLRLSITGGERTGLSDDIKTSAWMPSISMQTIKQKLLLPKPVWLQNTHKLLNNGKKKGAWFRGLWPVFGPNKFLFSMLSNDFL